MNLYKRVIEIVDSNLIFCLIPIVLTLMIAEFFYRKRFETKKVLKVVAKIIVIHTIFTLIYALVGIIFYQEKFEFIKKATGAYSWAYWMMFLSASILPLTLLIKKLSNNFFYVLFVAILMKIGYYAERFVIIITSLQQDNLTESENSEFIKSFTIGLIMFFLQGMMITIIALRIFEATKNFKNKGFINGL